MGSIDFSIHPRLLKIHLSGHYNKCAIIVMATFFSSHHQFAASSALNLECPSNTSRLANTARTYNSLLRGLHSFTTWSNLRVWNAPFSKYNPVSVWSYIPKRIEKPKDRSDGSGDPWLGAPFPNILGLLRRKLRHNAIVLIFKNSFLRDFFLGPRPPRAVTLNEYLFIFHCSSTEALWYQRS